MAKSPSSKTTSVFLSYYMGKTLILEEFVLGSDFFLRVERNCLLYLAKFCFSKENFNFYLFLLTLLGCV